MIYLSVTLFPMPVSGVELGHPREAPPETLITDSTTMGRSFGYALPSIGLEGQYLHVPAQMCDVQLNLAMTLWTCS